MSLETNSIAILGIAAGAAAVVGGGIALLAARASESVLATVYGWDEAQGRAADESLKRALVESLNDLKPRGPLPRIAVTPDPVPEARAVRAPGSAGVLYLSRGLLSLLDERELRTVLRAGFQRLQSRGIRRASSSAAWAVRLGRRSGVAAGAVALTPRRVLFGWLLFPLQSLLMTRSRPVDFLEGRADPYAGSFSGNEDLRLAWTTACRKAARVKKIHQGSASFRLL